MFQYPLVDRVGFEGVYQQAIYGICARFQYPLVDRVGFEGHADTPMGEHVVGFSILWWIELVLRGRCGARAHVLHSSFQYPLVDRVGF